MSHDPFGPYTQAGQTGWGQLIHGEQERARERAADIQATSDRIAHMNQPSAASIPLSRGHVASPQEKAELARRERNRKLIRQSAPFFKAISGHVVSYLDERGKLVVNGKKDLAPGEVVPQKVHLARLRLAHDTLWERILEEEEQKDTELAGYLCHDARERLTLSKRGRYLSPVNHNGRKTMCALYKTKRGFFVRKKRVKQRPWKLGLRGYDSRFRMFIDKLYTGTSPLSRCTSAEKTPLVACSAYANFEFFLSLPSSLGFDRR